MSGLSAMDKLTARAQLAKAAVVTSGAGEVEIPLSKIRFDPSQPRKAFHHLDGQVLPKDDAYIAELAQTIQAQGLIQAITVQEMDDGSYLVVVGECRTRAHLLMGASTIRAVVRNDLTNLALRLIYQIAENVNRKDLTDDELAASVRVLMTGAGGFPSMRQVEIATALGKTEGWVSRLVRFGDVELQRLWIESGIIGSSAENLYRVSILPESVKVDILRRVNLPVGDPERLEKPLMREQIDAFKRGATINKNVGSLSSGFPVGPSPLAAAAAVPVADVGLDSGSVPGSNDGWIHRVNGVVVAAPAGGAEFGEAAQVAGDSVAQSLAQEVVAGYVPPVAPGVPSVPVGSTVAGEVASPALGGYSLPAAARAALLGSVPVAESGQGSGGKVREQVQAPVSCRVSVASVLALLESLKSNEAVCSAVDGVQCDLIFPGGLAQLIANELAGVMVDHKEVPAVMQRELAKLR